MKTWEPGAKREWQHLALFGAATFVIGLAVTVWECRHAIAAFLVSVAPWWFIPVTAAVVGIVFFGWLIWYQSRPFDGQYECCADDSRKPWEE